MSDILLTQGMIDKAIREALNDFDKWVDVTGHVKMFSTPYHELQGLVEDAVLVGIQMASVGQISRRSDGTLILPTKSRRHAKKNTDANRCLSASPEETDAIIDAADIMESMIGGADDDDVWDSVVKELRKFIKKNRLKYSK